MGTKLRPASSPFGRVPIAEEASPQEHLRNLLLIGTYAARVKELAEDGNAPKKTQKEIEEAARRVDFHLRVISEAIKVGTITAETLYENDSFIKRAGELNSLFDKLAVLRATVDAGSKMQNAARKMRAKAEERGGRFSEISAEA